MLSAVIVILSLSAVRTRKQNRATNSFQWDEPEQSIPFYLLLCLLLALYGACRAAAWNSYFPSYAEKIICLVSVCAIAGGGVPLALGQINEEFNWRPGRVYCSFWKAYGGFQL